MPAKTKTKLKATNGKKEPEPQLDPWKEKLNKYETIFQNFDFVKKDEHRIKRVMLGALLEIIDNQNESLTPFEHLVEDLIWKYVRAEEGLEKVIRELTNRFFEEVEWMRDEAIAFDRTYGIHKTEAA